MKLDCCAHRVVHFYQSGKDEQHANQKTNNGVEGLHKIIVPSSRVSDKNIAVLWVVEPSHLAYLRHQFILLSQPRTLKLLNAKDSLFSQKKTLNLGGTLVSLDTPQVMGIINVTPDSFFARSRAQGEGAILRSAESQVKEGAFVLDVGGYSSRPGAGDVSLDEELSRAIPAIEAISREFPEVFLSIDTFRSEVAKQAVYAGAHMVNDISGGEQDVAMFDSVAELKVPYVLMHMKGTPKTMSDETQYNNLLTDIAFYFQERITKLRKLGVHDVIVDPGFGFAKTVEQNYHILQNLHYFNSLDVPVLVGFSRKSMIWKALDVSPEEALNGTSVLNTIALLQGASFLRVHDVKEAKQTITLTKQTFG